jgi:hypothetical protein
MAAGDVNYKFVRSGSTNNINAGAANLFGAESGLSVLNAGEVLLLMLSTSGGDVRLSLDSTRGATNDSPLRLFGAGSVFDIPPMTVANASQISFARDGGGSANTPVVFWTALVRVP